MARRALAIGAVFLLAVGWSHAAKAADGGVACARFIAPMLDTGAVITASRYQASSTGQLGRCVVRGAIVSSPRSTINFRVDLPDKAVWTGKLLVVGGGGFDGFVPTEADDPRRFPPNFTDWGIYVVASSDSGHQSRPAGSQLDFSWAAGNPSALRNHAFESNHLTLWTAVQIAEAYYGRVPKYRYMMGFSNGGRSGLMAAQRYPGDYHGIVAYAPAIGQVGFAANLAPLFKHIFAKPANWLGESQVNAYKRAEVAACDRLDGLEDGVIGNAGACRYDPALLRCTPGRAATDLCLTPGQIETVRFIYASNRVGTALADEGVGYPGYSRGSAIEWSPFFFGSSYAARDALNFVLADNIIKHGIMNDPNASAMTHQAVDWGEEYVGLSRMLDTTSPDLSGFVALGGKLIIWHGLADACVTHLRTADYLKSVIAKVGEGDFHKSVRFYTSPSLGHTLSGSGANIFDLIGPLQQWVEKGIPPGDLVAERRNAAGATQFERPLCRYPNFPRYRGRGDPNQASSFTCSPR